MEIAHVGFEEPPWTVFPHRNADESRVEIQPIHDEASSSQEPRVLAGATRNVKDRLAVRIEPTQQAGYLSTR